MADLQEETTRLLQRLIRFDTVNPPGNEREAQEFLAGYLAEAGFDCELVGAEEGRPNLVARLRGAGPGPVLGYLGHVDTVLATPEEWTHGPWSGDVADGFLWGRGALDMKSQVAAEVAGAASLARAGWRPARGELLLISVVDEEVGGILGAKWLTENHPDLVRCDYLVNEGGGPLIELGDRRFYTACAAEKGVFRFALTTDGVAGHASMPTMGDNALLKMAPLLERLGLRRPALDVTEEPRAFLDAIGEDSSDPEAALARLREADASLADAVEPMFSVTVVPTRISASDKINVIPSRAELRVDCRVPPGLGEAEALARIEEVIGPPGELGYQLEFTERTPGNRSPLDSALMEAIRAWVEEVDPGATVAPTVLPGFTDSRWFREAFPDCIAYGFCPHRHMTLQQTAPLVHSADERIDVRDLEYAASFFAWLAPQLLG
jgi:acetylornithine deacetylase/succinyl-diaminopimelate desuccinylase-like protein